MNSEEILRAELQRALAENERLRDENERLRLGVHQSTDAISYKSKRLSADANNRAPSSSALTNDSRPEAKVSLFRSVFRGRDDVYPVRWERSGRTGYSPAGIREWDRATSLGNSEKKSFRYSKLFPLSDEIIRDHLLGRQTIGVYPLLQDDTCWFVAVDFDKKNWQADALVFLTTCHETGVPAVLERSRSGNGGHVWIFSASPIQSQCTPTTVAQHNPLSA